MSERSKGLRALERWRGFDEDRASVARQLAVQVAASAAAATRSGEQQALAIGAERLALLQRPVLDLARLHASAAFEQAAWTEVGECEQRQQQADSDADAARLRQETAHRMTRAVAQRRERVQRLERDAEEKRLFDAMADLRRASHGGAHD